MFFFTARLRELKQRAAVAKIQVEVGKSAQWVVPWVHMWSLEFSVTCIWIYYMYMDIYMICIHYIYIGIYVYVHTCFKWMCWCKLGPRWLWWATVFNNFHRALRVDGAFDGQNNPIQAHKSGGGFWFPRAVLGNIKKTYKHRYKTSKDIPYSKRYIPHFFLVSIYSLRQLANTWHTHQHHLPAFGGSADL